ncbi:MAG: copper amine oxidase N-terminal domain-containing protein, partial [Clostridiales bacterium]
MKNDISKIVSESIELMNRRFLWTDQRRIFLYSFFLLGLLFILPFSAYGADNFYLKIMITDHHQHSFYLEQGKTVYDLKIEGPVEISLAFPDQSSLFLNYNGKRYAANDLPSIYIDQTSAVSFKISDDLGETIASYQLGLELIPPKPPEGGLSPDDDQTNISDLPPIKPETGDKTDPGGNNDFPFFPPTDFPKTDLSKNPIVNWQESDVHFIDFKLLADGKVIDLMKYQTKDQLFQIKLANHIDNIKFSFHLPQGVKCYIEDKEQNNGGWWSANYYLPEDYLSQIHIRLVSADKKINKQYLLQISTKKNRIIFVPGEKSISINGRKEALDAPPFIQNNKAMVPIRFV